MATPSSDTPAKIIVAVHGIGDQVGYETAQAVARQVGHYYDVAASIPLGRFYTGVGADNKAVPMPFLVTATDNPDLRRKTGFDVGFAEVYWASIPRVIVKDGHILEESKKWARTVATRLAQRAQSLGKPMPVREQIRLTTVLDEMIETVAIVERLNFVLAKAGVLQFDLNKLLTDFLGDVQIVVDFQSYRTQILGAFSEVMDQALNLEPKDQPRELYLIGHSEGSVITFLALLQALADQEAHPWIRSVKGVMTIGSPIEVHHLLWPSLWQELKPDSKPSAEALEIPWKNYYDFGDPIAYQLTATSDWMKGRFDRILKLEEIDYAHSYLPGKAHVDYWSDNEVFAHFIDNVVCTPRPAGVTAAPRPKTKWLPILVSYAVPKLLIAVLMCLAVYAIYRPVSAAVALNPVPSTQVFYDVLGLGLLLLGVTAAARMPRLTSKWRWWVAAAAGLALSLVAYEQIVELESRKLIGGLFLDAGRDPTRGVQAVAVIAALVAGALASWFPSWGTRILPIIGLLTIMGLMGRLLFSESRQQSELWPVVLGGAIFFYLWRVTALLFDLVFIWHRYVRHAAARDTIAEVCTDGYKGTKLETWTGMATNKAAAPAGAR